MTQTATESYVPETYLLFLQELIESGVCGTKTLNAKLAARFPDIPYSTRTRWIRAAVRGTAHANTPAWHRRTQEPKSIVPRRFSAFSNGRFAEAQRHWKSDGEIRLPNITCLHRPLGDGALLSLAMQMIEDFKPNALPVMSDWLHMNRFSQHPPKPQSFVPELPAEFDADNKPLPKVNRYKEFRDLTAETVSMFRSVTPKDCEFLNMWGNHEQWILREFLRIAQASQDVDLVEDRVNEVFSQFDELGLLWMEQDENRFAVLTPHFLLGHGWLTRSGLGTTAKAYLNKFSGQISIAVGHTHRQEDVWSRGPLYEHFAAVSGTLGLLRNVYNSHDWVDHNWGFQFITHPYEGWKGTTVEPVHIYYQKGYYLAKWRGKEYSEKATFDYDPLQDIFEVKEQ